MVVRVSITHSRSNSIHSGTMLHASPFNPQVANLPSGLKGGRLVLALPGASIARHAIEACVAGCGCRGAAHHTGRRRTTPLDQLKTLVHWACWTVRQQLNLRRHQARPKPRLGSLSSALSVRGQALAMRNAPGTGQQPPRRARNSAAFSLAMSARATPASVCREWAVNLTEAGQYFPDQRWHRIGGANVWQILLDPSRLHKQATVGLRWRCRLLLELLKPSDPVGHLLRPRDVLGSCPSSERKVGHAGPILKASMVGFTLLSRSYYYLRRRSPGPPFPPDHRQRQGNGGY